ncbi:DEAD/DEAH box helicase family protein, partial [Macellibacteroides fermentans]|uniref:DEAD/DEAH box helicase family protein n=1 Tax=Macellibacteroides fermentans TaxID=879969 RepID=UPI00352CB931
MQLLPGNIELTQNPFEKVIWNLLRSELKDYEGILGYKMPSLGSKDSVEIPSFIIRSKHYGIIVIDIVSSKIIKFEEDFQYWINPDNDEIYSRDIITTNYCRDIKNKLSKSTKLFNNKTEAFLFGDKKNPVKSLIVFPDNKYNDFDGIDFINKIADKDYLTIIKEFILSCKSDDITEDQIDEIDSILEGTSVFNRKRERILEEGKTRNDLIKKSLIQTFKLDSTQRSVALQVPNGPQRIRGLAGTGKTIILSMKAALTHISNENFKILFVFNTQSMYNQITSNIEKYTIEEASKAPDWNKLMVLHAWGGRRKEGLYSFLCSQYGLSPKTLYETKHVLDPYQYIFSDFLAKKIEEIVPSFVMVLIDVAQDFPP